MEITIANPQKGRLETIDIDFRDENTTWFEDCCNEDDIYTIPDFKGCLLIQENRNSYPVLLYGKSRTEIGHDKTRAKALIDRERY